jgi:hypothetical protein
MDKTTLHISTESLNKLKDLFEHLGIKIDAPCVNSSEIGSNLVSDQTVAKSDDEE